MDNRSTIATKPSKNFYEHPVNISHVWDAVDNERIPAIIAHIPQDIRGRSIEIGTAGGKLFRELRKRLPSVTGVDISFAALSSIGEGARVAANANRLPFKDNCFEVSIAADVLEHLSKEEFLSSVREIARVTQNYLIVNAPYRERYKAPVARCMDCGKEFNVYGHLRSFTEKKLCALFRDAGFSAIRVDTLGPYREWRSDFLLWLGRKAGKAYSSDFTVCPVCGSARINPKRSFVHRCIGKLLYTIQTVIDRLIPRAFKPRSEMIAVFQKIR